MPVDTARMCACFPSAYDRVRDSSEMRTEHAKQYLKAKCPASSSRTEKGLHYECPARGCLSIVIARLYRAQYGDKNWDTAIKRS